MAVEQPVPRPLRLPHHRHRRAGRHQLGHDAWTLTGRETAIAHGIAEAFDLEVEAVQVHRVHLRAQVDDPPPHRLGELVVQAFGVRPGEPVDREADVGADLQEGGARIVLLQDLGQLGAREARPLGDDEDAIGPRQLRRAGRR